MRDSSRAMDVVASGIGLVLLAPLFAVVAAWIKLDSPGPVFYRVEFRAFKFRSMVVGSDKAGPALTLPGDSRVTRSGSILRRTKIDEIPQLLNVFRGEMALVGPRPEDPRYVETYGEEQRQLLAVRPGITSPASLRYWYEERELAGPDWETRYREIVLPDKLALDLAYLRTRSIGTDLRLVARTLSRRSRSS
jgi:lipopolysaccharide/colanic/teichoic acid biosynthesis glycosyltransferase